MTTDSKQDIGKGIRKSAALAGSAMIGNPTPRRAKCGGTVMESWIELTEAELSVVAGGDAAVTASLAATAIGAPPDPGLQSIVALRTTPTTPFGIVAMFTHGAEVDLTATVTLS